MLNQITGIGLGLGLISIGREWGHVKSVVPEERGVLEFLEFAYASGITFFDTAPSYGTSEERLGKFLRTLETNERDQIIVASKFGDHWNSQLGTAYVDHSYNALCASLDNSLFHLDKIDLLQLHKTNPQVLRSKDLRKALEYARTANITTFGASISDEESGLIVCDDELFSAIQLPYNLSNTSFETIIDRATKKGKLLIINRPYNMGALLYAENKSSGLQTRIDAYRFILRRKFNGIILTGTQSRQHLLENLGAFKIALST